MAAQHRLNGQAYTCKNVRFWTDTSKGKPHGPGQASGSVFDQPLVSGGGFSLWREHVVDRDGGWEPFWLMWYDANGDPTIPLSGVFDRDQLREMVSRLASFIQVP
jgi:hypothetical protein